MGAATLGTNAAAMTKADIERVPVDNLKAFYKRYYQPDNATLIVTGKFDQVARGVPAAAFEQRLQVRLQRGHGLEADVSPGGQPRQSVIFRNGIKAGTDSSGGCCCSPPCATTVSTRD